MAGMEDAESGRVVAVNAEGGRGEGLGEELEGLV